MEDEQALHMFLTMNSLVGCFLVHDDARDLYETTLGSCLMSLRGHEEPIGM